MPAPAIGSSRWEFTLAKGATLHMASTHRNQKRRANSVARVGVVRRRRPGRLTPAMPSSGVSRLRCRLSCSARIARTAGKPFSPRPRRLVLATRPESGKHQSSSRIARDAAAGIGQTQATRVSSGRGCSVAKALAVAWRIRMQMRSSGRQSCGPVLGDLVQESVIGPGGVLGR